MKHLIINADDFGYSYGVNKGIIEAHTNGVVTSTSVLVDAVAAHEAVDLKQFPNLSVGLHFAVSDLTNVQAEFDRQIGKFISIIGVKPTHLDTHKIHTTEPAFREVLTKYATENKIPVRDFGYAKFINIFFASNPDDDVSVDRLKLAIDAATDEYNEIMCHVGYADDYILEHSSYNAQRERELHSVCDPDVRKYIQEKGLELINWKSVVA